MTPVLRVRFALVAAAMIIALLPISAAAEDPGDSGDHGTVQVGPAANGPVVTQGAASYDSGGIQAGAQSQTTAAPTAEQPAAYNGPVYTYRPVPYNAIPAVGPIQANSQGVISNPTGPGAQSACPNGQTGYNVYDSQGNSLGMVCVANPSDNLPPPNSPEIALAEQASSHQPWPALTLGINPGVGLTGMSSWFWLAGAGPSVPDATASAGPLTVTVRARLAGVTWEFGDGMGYDSADFGRAFPAPSNVQHVYQTDTYGLQAGYTVSGILRYLVTYSVNGGPWTTLGVKTKAFSQQYPVFQAQPQAVASR